jgi:hypothetical protein
VARRGRAGPLAVTLQRSRPPRPAPPRGDALAEQLGTLGELKSALDEVHVALLALLDGYRRMLESRA